VSIVAELELRGAGGEPVDLWRTLASHGLAFLAPARVDEAARAMEVTIPGPLTPRTVRLEAAPGGADPGPEADDRAGGGEAIGAAVLVRLVDAGPPCAAAERDQLVATLRRMLCLDDDLSVFYAKAATDPQLAWARRGAGRLLRSPSVFEDLVKTMCTVNCAWSATVRMVEALVRELGEPAPGAAAGEAYGRAFPTPAAMAGAGDDFYRQVARAGYRGPRLQAVAAAVAAGELDLEVLRAGVAGAPPDDEVEARLLALSGVGPYAAAHVMLLLGRSHRLVLDSWTRPKYAQLQGKPPGKLVPDATIVRRFRRYGRFAGLAFWLVVTQDWVDEEQGTGIR
jgi:3-methyladenine DNA glycosylase/8-oxoguanine DNA glycosylase